MSPSEPTDAVGFRERLEWLITEKFDGSAAALARAVQCGASTVTGWRKGAFSPSRRHLRSLAAVTGTREHWLAYGEGPRSPAASEVDGKDYLTFETPFSVEKPAAAPQSEQRTLHTVRLMRAMERRLRRVYEDAGVPISEALENQVVEHFLELVERLERESGQPLVGSDGLGALLVDLVLVAHRDAVQWTVQKLAISGHRKVEE